MDFDDLDEAPGGRLYDLVVYGAAGYSGCLIVEHFDALMTMPDAAPRKWAVAGRDKRKLERIAKRCKTGPAIIEALDEDGLQLMAEMCSVVINAAGPFMVCGTGVVAACIAKKTHYVDITGELVWMKRMIKAHHEQAKERGVMIVHCAGFMCVPEDLSMYLLASKLGPLRQFRNYQMEIGAGAGGGTFLSGFVAYEEMLSHELEALTDPFSLGGCRGGSVRKEDEDPVEAKEDALFPGVWLSGGHSTPCAMRILRRSCELFEGDAAQASPPGAEAPPCYGDAVCITSRYCFGQQGLAKQRAHTTREPRDIHGLIKHAETMRNALQKGQIAPPGGGPTRSARGQGFVEYFAIAEGESGDWAHVHIRGPDIYEVTALAVVAGALVILDDSARIAPKERGGVLTPAYAFHGSKYVERLTAKPFANLPGRGIAFDVCEGKPDEAVLREAILKSDTKAHDIFQKQVRNEVEGSWAPPELLQ